MMERTRMFSDSPGTPGRSAHTPRTMRSILTPAAEASYSAAMIWGRAARSSWPRPRRFFRRFACSVSRWMAASTWACRVKGDCHRCRSLPALPRLVSCMNTSFTSAQMSSSQVNRPKSVYSVAVRE